MIDRKIIEEIRRACASMADKRCPPMPEVPSMSSRKLVRFLEKGGARFVRQGSTDHAIYARIVEGKRVAAPVQIGKSRWIPIIVSGSCGH
jgi:predicted RNA binding protein YcfA (HicA-like mRNA interferase family)